MPYAIRTMLTLSQTDVLEEKMVEPALNQTPSCRGTPLALSSSGVMQPRAPSMAQRAWITSSSR